MDGSMTKKKRGRPALSKDKKKKRIIKKRCPMCEDLNKNNVLNKNKITTIVDVKPVIFDFQLP